MKKRITLSDQSALDDVEKKLSSEEGDSEKIEDGLKEAKEEKEEKNVKDSDYLERNKPYSYSGIKNDNTRGDSSEKKKSSAKLFSLDDEKKEKLKKFLLSNKGIATIAGSAIILFLIGSVAFHHSTQEASSKDASSWNRAEIKPVISTQQAINKRSDMIAGDINAPSNTQAVVNIQPATQDQIQAMNTKLDDLGAELQTIDARLQAISDKLDKHQVQAKNPKINYQVLGERLNQETNQWVVDVVYKGQLKPYAAGQQFGNWVVRAVDSNGVDIRPRD